MTWADIAGKDFRDAIRSPWVSRLTVLYVLAFPLYIVLAFILRLIPLPEAVNLTNEASALFIVGFRSVSVWIVPGIAIVMAYASITDERDSGSVKVLLSLPHSRSDLLLGKVIGRSGVVIVPVLIGLLFGGLFLYGTGRPVVLGDYLFFSAMTLLLGIVFTALSVGLSAFMGSNRRAIFASLGLYVLFVFLWTDVLLGGGFALVRWVLNAGFDVTLTGKQVFDVENFVELLNPIGAYKDIVGVQVLGGGIVQSVYATNNYGPVPFYLTHRFSVVVMFAWTVLSTVIGVVQLRRIDL
jgi:ABC-2 type transport system permease protein